MAKHDDEHTIANRQWNAYVRARDEGHRNYVDTSKRCNKYYWGDQWDDADLAKLREQGRPALTINEILPTVNTILGEQSRTRADAQFKPRNGLTQVAEALNKVYLQVADNNGLEWLESTVFTDGIIGGRGFFDIRIDFSDTIAGEIKITAEDPHDVIIDPDAKDYDPASWKEVLKTRWLSVDDVEEIYGKEQAEKIKYISDDYDSFGIDSIQTQDTFANNNDGGSINQIPTGEEADDRCVRKIRVIERQYRKLRKMRMFVDNNTGDMREIPDDMDDARIETMVQQFNLSVTSKLKSAVRWTVTADRFVLFDDWSPYKEFTIVPYFAYFRRGKPFGVVENLLSPQDNLNKVASQELHVVNTTANSGWTFESGTLVGMTRDDLERDGSKTGLAIEHARNSNPPQKIQPNQIPTGLDRISMKAAQFVRDISGVSESMLGYDGAEVSGVAIERKQSRGLTQMQALFDNLAKTRYILAKRILELVQRFYTEERVVRTTNYVSPEKEQEETVVNQMTPEGIVINDLTLGEYDVAITSVPARDTFEDSQFAEALSMRNAGVMIPDDTVIEYSSLAHKHEIAERVRQLTGTGTPSPEQMQMQAMMQQLEIQRIQLELGELEGKIADLNSKAQLNQAKAAEIMQDKDGELAGVEARQEMERFGVEMQVEREKLANALTQKREQLQTMLQIAAMQKETQESQMRQNAMENRLKAKETSAQSAGKSRKGLSDTASGRKA